MNKIKHTVLRISKEGISTEEKDTPSAFERMTNGEVIDFLFTTPLDTINGFKYAEVDSDTLKFISEAFGDNCLFLPQE